MNPPITTTKQDPRKIADILTDFSAGGFLLRHHENTIYPLPENADCFANETAQADKVDFITGLIEFMKKWPG